MASNSSGFLSSSRVRIFLLRHGQTDFNYENRLQGSSNKSFLTEKGVEQAAGARTFLRNRTKNGAIQIGISFCSPLGRALDTLAVVRSGAAGDSFGPSGCPPPQILEDLREIDLHEWEGLLAKDVMPEGSELDEKWRHRPHLLQLPQSEKFPFLELVDRAGRVWSQMRSHCAQKIGLSTPLPGDTGNGRGKQGAEEGDEGKRKVEEEREKGTESTKQGGEKGTCAVETKGQRGGETEEKPRISNQEREEGEGRVPDVLVVAHGALNRALLLTSLGLNAEHFRKFSIPNCGIIEIEADWGDHIPQATKWRFCYPEEKKTDWSSQTFFDTAADTASAQSQVV
uniref:Phosphoglycerate mutase family protein n=1 Tax=Chromera velia CCMP2878 TaxID=1169474 RepID=A0A0G4HZ03_9ALVE|eukprot:Cvel_9619.t1-p1 / transcript=Cvel_9619.t1 / gene=Cvel_9619 / organism=Chromera_velia_CCMP2878 / gene_product=Uncharacterized protein Mb2253c, putative / transcript_product=Uncharacterized protein Mb2253c, putative / location=Cvel_scaffold559:44106-46689(+) / protein_length=339 / sequence_SO=supercontig / SO=protein_coding / is_pseudo=false